MLPLPVNLCINVLEYEMGSLLPAHDSSAIANGAADWSHWPPTAPSPNLIVSLTHSNVSAQETAASYPNDGSLQWENVGIIPGLSESDFMSRQRYLGEHRCVCVRV